MSDDQVIARVKHIRAAGLCSKGSRAWFLKHRLDWPAFLRDGIPAETLEEINDPMGNAVARAARGQQQ